MWQLVRSVPRVGRRRTIQPKVAQPDHAPVAGVPQHRHPRPQFNTGERHARLSRHLEYNHPLSVIGKIRWAVQRVC
jgi:hypothetical protein